MNPCGAGHEKKKKIEKFLAFFFIQGVTKMDRQQNGPTSAGWDFQFFFKSLEVQVPTYTCQLIIES